MSNTTFTPPFNGYDVAAIANEFLRLAKKEERPLTNMQLQKLPYIAHGWSLALREKPLTLQHPQVWQYGPVYPELYKDLRVYGAGTVSDYIYDNGWNPLKAQLFGDDFSKGEIITANFTDLDRLLIHSVWETYKNYDAFQLSALTHREGTPWSVTKERSGLKSVIDNSLIQEHYCQLAARNNHEDRE